MEGLLEKHQLPYRTSQEPDGSWILNDRFTRGDLHLQKFITIEDTTIVMKKRASKCAQSDYEVLITGETGTGKEIIAKSMIGARQGEIKALNCAGFPEQLMESELFGYVRGAFTGADSTRDGLMISANGGVLFMDEIGEMPMHLQAKLLRALQEKTVRKVGGKQEEPITCKFVFATHKDLKKMVMDGEFRRDLYARISTLELDIKSLTPSRMSDVVPITKSLSNGEKFLEKYEKELKDGTLDLSLNVRSLQQHVIRFSIFGEV